MVDAIWGFRVIRAFEFRPLGRGFEIRCVRNGETVAVLEKLTERPFQARMIGTGVLLKAASLEDLAEMVLANKLSSAAVPPRI